MDASTQQYAHADGFTKTSDNQYAYPNCFADGDRSTYNHYHYSAKRYPFRGVIQTRKKYDRIITLSQAND